MTRPSNALFGLYCDTEMQMDTFDSQMFYKKFIQQEHNRGFSIPVLFMQGNDACPEQGYDAAISVLRQTAFVHMGALLYGLNNRSVARQFVGTAASGRLEA